MAKEGEGWRGRTFSSLWFRRNASFRAAKIRRRFLNRNAGVETLSTPTELKTRAQTTFSVENLVLSHLFSKRITLRPSRTRSPHAKNPRVTFSRGSIRDGRQRNIYWSWIWIIPYGSFHMERLWYRLPTFESRIKCHTGDTSNFCGLFPSLKFSARDIAFRD